jgi:Transglutaminase-like superfamily
MVRAITAAIRVSFRDPRRAWLMARMATWVLVLSGLVNFCSLPRALHLVSTSTRKKRKGQGLDRPELSGAIDAVLGVNFFVFKPSCWKRATVLHRYLALRGVPTKIIFGLRKEPDGELKGHAWLEADGQPILESEAPAYKTTYIFPSAEPFEVELALMAAQTRQTQP